MSDEAPIAEVSAPAVVDPPAEQKPDAPVERVRDPNTIYKQEDVDKIVKAAKANERYRTKREIEAYYSGRLEATQPAQVATPAAPEKPADEDKPPARDQFNSYEEYLDAKAEYTGRKAAENYRIKVESEAKAAKEVQTATERANSFREKLTTKFPDIGERARDIAHITIPAHVVESMQESEYGPDILNGFIDNPKELERIMALSPSSANREMGKLEARYEAAVQKPDPSATVAPAPSRAPTPLRPVAGSAIKTDDEPSHDKPDEWRMWREKQLLKRKTATQKA